MEFTEKRKTPRRTRSQWEQLVKECENSGLPAQQFCEHAGLPYASFINWRSEIRKETQVQMAPFVEVATSFEDGRPTRNQWAVELSLGNGMVLRINPGPCPAGACPAHLRHLASRRRISATPRKRTYSWHSGKYFSPYLQKCE